MTTLFNVGVGIGFAILALLPFLLMRRKWHLWAVFAISLGFGLVGYMLSKNYLYPHYLGWEFEQQIKKQPLFALIEKHHPEEFKEFINKARKSLSKNEGLDVITSYSTELTNRIFYQHLQTAPDANILQYLKSTLDLYRYLYVIDPRAVVKLENGDESIPVDLQSFWEDKSFQSLLNQVLQAKQKIIEGSITNPAPLPTQEMTTPILNSVLDELIGKFGKDVVRSVFTPTSVKIPPKLAAAVIIDFYAAIVASGPEKAGIVMRHIADLKMKGASPNQKVPGIDNAEKDLPAAPTNTAPDVVPSIGEPPVIEPAKDLSNTPSPTDSAPPPTDNAPSPADNVPSQVAPTVVEPPKDSGVQTSPSAPPAAVMPPAPEEGKNSANSTDTPSLSKDIEPPKTPKEIENPIIPKGVEIPKTPKEVVIPKTPKEVKTP